MSRTLAGARIGERACGAGAETLGAEDEAPMIPRFDGALVRALPFLGIIAGAVGCQAPPVEDGERIQAPAAASGAPAPLPASAAPTASSAAAPGATRSSDAAACAGCIPVGHPGFGHAGCFRTGSPPGLPMTSVPIDTERCDDACCSGSESVHRVNRR
jgi:hypothetical protein